MRSAPMIRLAFFCLGLIIGGATDLSGSGGGVAVIGLLGLLFAVVWIAFSGRRGTGVYANAVEANKEIGEILRAPEPDWARIRELAELIARVAEPSDTGVHGVQ